MVVMQHCGLFFQNRPLPLESFDSVTTMTDNISQTVLSFTFQNPFQGHSLECVFKFPLDDQAAVCGFDAELDGVTVVGLAKEKEQAFRDYDQAIARGDGAFLAEDEGDLFVINVGNLPAGKRAVIRLTYVTRMISEGPAVRFCLPLAIVPRYTPGQQAMAPTDKAFDGPEYAAAWERTFPVTIKVNLVMSSQVDEVTSPSHPIVKDGDNQVTLASTATQMDKDFVLLVRTRAPNEPQVAAEVATDGSGSAAAMLSLCPVFPTATVPQELIFVVDRSGSMGGARIESTKNALQLFLRSINPGSKFNIVSFGSHSSALYTAGSVAYTEQSMQQATAHVASMGADMGGTEILSAINMLSSWPVDRELSRQVFLLTDGEVSNTDAVIAAVRSTAEATGARFFSFGIGNGASQSLVNGIARAGRGQAEFILEGERIEAKVMRQLKRAVQPSLRNVTVTWTKGGVAVQDVQQAPIVTPPIFSGDRFSIYGLFANAGSLPDTVVLSGDGPTGPLQASLAVPSTPRSGMLLHRMGAREIIRELEEDVQQAPQQLGGSKQRRASSAAEQQPKRTNKDLIVELATRYNLASKHTSFVAIDSRAPKDKVPSHNMKLVNVAVPPPAPAPAFAPSFYSGGAGGGGGGIPAPSGAPMMRMAAVNSSISNTRGVMQTNIDKVMSRSDQLDSLQLKSESLESQSKTFRKSSASAGSGITGFFSNLFGGSKSRKGSADVSSSAAPAPAPAPQAPRRESEKKIKESRASIVRDEEGCCDDEDDAVIGDSFANFASAPAPPPPTHSSAPSAPAPPPPTHSSAPSAKPSLSSIVMLQKFDGSFGPLTQALAAALGKPLADLEAFVKAQGGDSARWTTALAVACVETFFASQKDEWDMLVDKARAFLGEKSAAMIAEAKKLF